MAAPSKIQDEREAVRWIESGKSYQWIVDEYRRKYHIETTISMWSNFRRKKGLDRRIARNDDLIPWEIAPEHRANYNLAMLRVEARLRAGMDLRDVDATRLLSWKRGLREDGVVVAYDDEHGFTLVPRRSDDADLIRKPSRGVRLTRRRNAG